MATKRKVRVIDDSVDTRLREHEFETVYAAGAMQAHAVVCQTRSDAVVLDLGLSSGNGIDRTASMLALRQTLAIDARGYSISHASKKPIERPIIRKKKRGMGHEERRY
ncbi:MAG TPA: hypothetical protein VFX56_00760 [Nitrospira sp.]|nr:hypothetical protein [Nitrospira sp.]